MAPSDDSGAMPGAFSVNVVVQAHGILGGKVVATIERLRPDAPMHTLLAWWRCEGARYVDASPAQEFALAEGPAELVWYPHSVPEGRVRCRLILVDSTSPARVLLEHPHEADVRFPSLGPEDDASG